MIRAEGNVIKLRKTHSGHPNNVGTRHKAGPSGLERHKRLSIVCAERWSQSNEEQERGYRATHDEYATRVGKRWDPTSAAQWEEGVAYQIWNVLFRTNRIQI